MISPLQLIDYTAETLRYERLDPEPVPKDMEIGVGLGFEIDTAVEEERNAQRLTLSVHFNDKEDDIPKEIAPHIAHRGQVRVQGWVRWINKDMSERDDAQRLLLTNGLSMLYGIARVHTAQLTAGRTSARLLLPSVSFQPMVDEWMEVNGDDSDA